MSVNIFHDPTKKLPDKDPRIVKIDMETSDIGARKSHLPKSAQVKNQNSIDHVKG